MVRIICPNCRKVHSVMPHIGDFICNCAENRPANALTQEDVVVIGKYEDFENNTFNTFPLIFPFNFQPNLYGNKTNFYLGIENKEQGTISEIEGVDTEDLTDRGNRKTTHRTRSKLQYIKLD